MRVGSVHPGLDRLQWRGRHGMRDDGSESEAFILHRLSIILSEQRLEQHPNFAEFECSIIAVEQ